MLEAFQFTNARLTLTPCGSRNSLTEGCAKTLSTPVTPPNFIIVTHATKQLTQALQGLPSQSQQVVTKFRNVVPKTIPGERFTGDWNPFPPSDFIITGTFCRAAGIANPPAWHIYSLTLSRFAVIPSLFF